MDTSSVPFGAFELQEVLGKGGMAEVWRGVHRRQQVPVAVKIMTTTHALRADFRDALRHEVRAIAGLDHPNIVTVYDYGEVDLATQQMSGDRFTLGSPYLAMELATGGTLRSVTRSLDWAELKRILLSVLDALAHAHARGVIHLDLKPANVLVCPGADDIAYKLADFGIAYINGQPLHLSAGESSDSLLETVERRTLVQGTPPYMAPEQFTYNYRDFGPWTDLYALGCLAFALVAGAPPFNHKDHQLMADAHLHTPAPPLFPRMAVPGGLEAWIHRLLEKHPGRRFQRAADAMWALRQLGEAEEMLELHELEPLEEPDEDPAEAIRSSMGPTITIDVEVQAALHSSLKNGIRRPPQSEPPPLPDTWHRHVPSRRPQTLAGVGLTLYGLRTVPLAGRARERDVIWNTLIEVRQASQPRLILLHGPAGTGKTRLAEWIVERSHEVGNATILKAVHSPSGGPGDGLARMVVRFLRCQGLDRHVALARVRGMLLEQGIHDEYEWSALTEFMVPSIEDDPQLASLPDTSGTEPSMFFERPEERYALLSRLLERLGTERPVIVWMEDVQWGSDALSFAEHVLTKGGSSRLPVLFLLTAQDEAMAERAAESHQLDELMRLEGARRVSIGPLSNPEHVTLLRDLLGLEAPLAQRVVERTGGNPMFAVQLVRDWVQRDLLELGTTGFTLRSGIMPVLPRDIHQVWQARIDRLLEDQPPDARRALEIAAALGQEVNTLEWRAVCELAHLSMPDNLLETLLANRLARATSMGEAGLGIVAWSFVHGMLQESIEQMSKDATRWEDNNWLCGSMLLKLYPPERPGVFERLGHHALAAGELEAALDPLFKAAQAHRRLGDIRQAHRLLAAREGAIAALEIPEDDRRVAEGWLLRARLLSFQGKVREAMALMVRVEATADRNGLHELRAEAKRVRARAHLDRGEPEVAIPLLRDALAWFEKNGIVHRMANCLMQLASAEYERGNLSIASSNAQRALKLSQELGDARSQGDCSLILGYIALGFRQERQAAALFQSAIKHFSQVNYQPGLAHGLRCLGCTIAESNPDQASDLYRRSLGMFERLGYRSGEARCRNDLAELARLRGDLEAAEDGYRRTLALCSSLQSGDSVVVQSNLALVYLEQRRYTEARQSLEACRKTAEASGRRLILASIQVFLVRCAAAERDWKAWDRYFVQALASIRETGVVDRDIARQMQLAGEHALEAGELGRTQDALRVAARLWRIRKQNDEAERIEKGLTSVD